MKIRKILVAGVLALLLGLMTVPSYAAMDPPPIPHAFHGDVSLYCKPAPVGTTIEARCEGMVLNDRDNPVTTTEVGKYGNDLKLVVQGYIPDGTRITFWVNGIQADQTCNFESGESTKLDLTVSAVTLTVESSAGGSVTAPGVGVFPYHCGDSVSLLAVPAAGYHFVDWTGSVESAHSAATTTSIDGFKTVKANFAINTYPLDLTISGHGQVDASPQKTVYDHGSSVQLTAAADQGWSFAGWAGDVTGTENPKTVIMDGPKSAFCNFTQNDYTLSLTAVNGTVSKNPDQSVYHFGDAVILTAEPSTGYHFVAWSGAASGGSNPVTITIAGNTSVTADFALNTYSLSVTTTGNGIVTKNPGQENYPYNSDVQLTAEPSTGYHFTGWSGDLSGSTNPATIKMTGNKSVVASFAINTYTLTLDALGYGCVFKNPVQDSYAHGTQVILTATADTGHHFVNWTIGSTTFTDNPLTITMDGNKTVVAHFDDYLLVHYYTGWNTLSVPITVSADYDTWGEFKTRNELKLQAESPAYYYYYFIDSTDGRKKSAWGVVDNAYPLRPCDAIYVRMASDCTALIVPGSSSTTPTKDLDVGWNLISLNSYQNMNVADALNSIYYATGTQKPWGYTQVISPYLPCQEYWTYARDGGTPPNMELGRGYWVWMINPGTLAGWAPAPPK